MRDRGKYYVTQMVMTFLKVFWIFPVKYNWILNLSYGGKQYSDSPRCLSEEIHRRYPEKRIIWVLDRIEDKDIPSYIKIVKSNSLSFLFFMCVAGTIITNNTVNSYIPIRRSQILLNTWHGGGPTKTIGFRASIPSSYDKYYFKLQEAKTTAMISSSTFFTQEEIKESFGFLKPEIVEVGLPRNDILFRNHDDVTNKVYGYFNLQRNPAIGLVLYAPTFRGTTQEGKFINPELIFSVNDCKAWLKERFQKDFIFLFRAHHTMNIHEMEGSLNASEYPDMQELLCAVDILITDYSSCMHDFALTGKPVFLYVPDYEEYMAERGFYYSIPSMPFPFAKDIQTFKEIIKGYDQERYNADVEKYLLRMGNYDKGTATDQTILWLRKKWNMQRSKVHHNDIRKKIW